MAVDALKKMLDRCNGDAGRAAPEDSLVFALVKGLCQVASKGNPQLLNQAIASLDGHTGVLSTGRFQDGLLCSVMECICILADSLEHEKGMYIQRN